MFLRKKMKMLFKIGITLIIGVAVYMYYALNETQKKQKKDVAHGDETLAEMNLNINGVKDDQETDNTTVDRLKSAVSDRDVAELLYNQPGTHDKDSNKNIDNGKQLEMNLRQEPKSVHWSTALHLAVVACGERQEETLVMLKSAVLFSRSLLVLHIFLENELQKPMKDQLDFWPPSYREKIEYHIYNLSFPLSENYKIDEWKSLFKLCASQRLFIPNMLSDVDALLYVDTDVLFLSPIDEIWAFFSQFNATQMVAVSPEHEDAAIGWYNRFSRHPYYGKLGINSGVMLMNLTRIRQSDWMTSMFNYYKEYKFKITWGDQDLINIYFHFFPHQLFVFNCEWNYRPDNCMYTSVCPGAEVTGVHVLHGCRFAWHNDKQPAFKAVYTAVKKHRLGESIQYDLLPSLNSLLNAASPSNCGNIRHVFTMQIEKYIKNNKQNIDHR